MAAILRSMEHRPPGFLTLDAHMMEVDIDSYDATTPAIARGSLDRHHKREAGAWIESIENDFLGNAVSEAEYLDFYGTPRNSFPCASNCESNECIAGAFDSVKQLSREVTTGCFHVIYFGVFEEDVSDLIRPDEVSDDEEEIYDEGELCRVAYVSGKSVLVEKVLAAALSGDDRKDARKVRMENGKHVVNRWSVIWLANIDESTMSDVDKALLRIDPSGLFSESVEIGMYTEVLSYIKLSDAAAGGMLNEQARTHGSCPKSIASTVEASFSLLKNQNPNIDLIRLKIL
jgi:hypothetical protein